MFVINDIIWVHVVPLAIFWVHAGPLAILWVHVGLFAIFWVYAGLLALFWVHAGHLAIALLHVARPLMGCKCMSSMRENVWVPGTALPFGHCVWIKAGCVMQGRI